MSQRQPLDLNNPRNRGRFLECGLCYGARPYGFQFTTRERNAKDLDSKVTKKSGFYFLGGKVLTLADVEKLNDPKEAILRSNMRNNRWHKIVVNDNSWRWTQPLRRGDKVLDVQL